MGDCGWSGSERAGEPPSEDEQSWSVADWVGMQLLFLLLKANVLVLSKNNYLTAGIPVST